MRHNVVAEAPLVTCSQVQVAIVEVGAHLRDCLLGNVEAELALRLSQCQPEPAPKADPVTLTPQRLHGRRGIP
jgi:hypothetical protein